MKTCVISQSNYIPWKGYFQMIAQADVFVFYDVVQFTKRDWRSRNKIMTPRGPVWLTIPVGGNRDRRIDEVILPDGEWRQNHIETIRRIYSYSDHIDDLRYMLEPIFEDREIILLSEFNQAIIRNISEYLEIDTVFMNASDFDIEGERTERLIGICKEINADVYLSGPSAQNYIKNEFDDSGIELKWMEYGPFKEYEQCGPIFSHEVSIVDTIAVLGKNTIKQIIQ
ncbi:MAG: hypothetical protein CMB54_00210 [Euryarchaeota archaeon]|nr:hypothetical protein [Euryarchaeota archaeon]